MRQRIDIHGMDKRHDAIAQTNPEQSKNSLAQATEIFRKLGAKRELEKAEAKQASRT